MDRDRSSLFYVARALHGLQQQWGTIPHVKGKGDAAAAGGWPPQLRGTGALSQVARRQRRVSCLLRGGMGHGAPAWYRLCRCAPGCAVASRLISAWHCGRAAALQQLGRLPARLALPQCSAS